MKGETTYGFELRIQKQLNAFLFAKQKGAEDACEMYPLEKEFILKNIHRSFEDVRMELLSQLERIAV